MNNYTKTKKATSSLRQGNSISQRSNQMNRLRLPCMVPQQQAVGTTTITTECIE